MLKTLSCQIVETCGFYHDAPEDVNEPGEVPESMNHEPGEVPESMNQEPRTEKFRNLTIRTGCCIIHLVSKDINSAGSEGRTVR